MEKFLELIGGVLFIIWVLLVLLLLTALVWTGVIATKSRFWITQYDNSYYTDEYREKDGCVYFKDNWTGNDGKLCGDYSIKEWD